MTDRTRSQAEVMRREWPLMQSPSKLLTYLHVHESCPMKFGMVPIQDLVGADLT
jgi:hypothetical protein